MEPYGEEPNSPDTPWDDIRELDSHEKWRDRNSIITKHEHRGNSRCIGQLVVELFDEIVDSIIQPDKASQQQETNDVIENTALPYIVSDFDDLLVDFSSQPKESLLTNENEFTPGSNFDFELNYLEQFSSQTNIDYFPRDSLFRNFDPLATQPPISDKTVAVPQSADLPLPEGSSVLDEVLDAADSSDSEVSENKETSFCSCQTKFPEETHNDALTSGDDYESTSEEAALDCKMVTSPLNSKFTSNANNLERIVVGDIDQDFGGSNPINLDENNNFAIPIDSKQTELHGYAIENEEFRPSHEVDLALEYLEDLDIGIHDPNMPRESLFTRFDPLTQHTMPPNELLRRCSQLSNSSTSAYTSETPAKAFKNANLLTFSTPPKSQQTPRLSITTPRPEVNTHSLLPNMTPVILDKPTKHALLSSSDSNSVLRYTESEVKADIQKARDSGRAQLDEFIANKNKFLESEKLAMLEILENERKKCNYIVKVKKGKLQELKDEIKSNLTSVMTSKSGVEVKCQSLQADANLHEVKKDLMTSELEEAANAVESSNERKEQLVIDTDKLHSRKCKVVLDLEDMISSLAIFQTKISEATDSLKLNLNRINELIVKIEQTAKTSRESETRFNRLQERAINKLSNANTIHEEHSREYKQKLLVVKTELRTRKIELSDLQLSFKSYEAKNENLQAIAKEMMELHQPAAKK